MGNQIAFSYDASSTRARVELRYTFTLILFSSGDHGWCDMMAV